MENYPEIILFTLLICSTAWEYAYNLHNRFCSKVIHVIEAGTHINRFLDKNLFCLRKILVRPFQGTLPIHTVINRHKIGLFPLQNDPLYLNSSSYGFTNQEPTSIL